VKVTSHINLEEKIISQTAISTGILATDAIKSNSETKFKSQHNKTDSLMAERDSLNYNSLRTFKKNRSY